MAHYAETTQLTPAVSTQDYIQGPETAAVTLVKYGDYECPYCGRAYPIVKEIQRRLGGQLRFVFRNFPLSNMHPNAEHTTEAAEAFFINSIRHDGSFALETLLAAVKNLGRHLKEEGGEHDAF